MRALLAVSILAVCAFGQLRRTDLTLAVTAECALTNVASTSTSSSEGAQSVVTGITRFTYLLRTSKPEGAAEIRFQFLPAPAAPGAVLTYTTTLTGPGNHLSGNNLQPSSPAVAAIFGSNAHTTSMGESGTIEWTWRGPSPALPSAPGAPTLSISCH